MRPLQHTRACHSTSYAGISTRRSGNRKLPSSAARAATRYAPPARMIKLTETMQITPYK